MTLELKAIFAFIVVVLIGLAAWGVKHAVDVFQETQKENAALHIQNTELSTSLREQERSSAIVMQVATSNKGAQYDIRNLTDAVRNSLRALERSDPATRDWAPTPLPPAVSERLRKRSTDADGYPVLQGKAGQPGAPDAGAGQPAGHQ